MSKKVIVFGLIFLLGEVAFSQTAFDSSKQQSWVDSVFSSLNKNERIGQLFIERIDSNSASIETNRLIKSNKIGGVYFTNTSPSKQVALVNSYQQQTETPLFVSMPLRNGQTPDLPQTFNYPEPNTLNIIKDTLLRGALKSHTKEQLKILGSNIQILPVDVNSSNTWDDELLYKLGANQLYTNDENSFFMIGSNNVDLAIKNFKKSIRKNPGHKSYIYNNIMEILKSKYYACPIKSITNPDNLVLKLSNPKYEVLIEKIHNVAITLESQNLLPFEILDTTIFASLTINGDATVANRYLSKYAFFNHFEEDKDYSSLENKLASFNVVVVNIINPSELSEKQFTFLKSLSKRTALVVCFYGNTSNNLSMFQHQVFAYENSKYTQKLVPQHLFGALSNTGPTINRLVYSIPESAEVDSYLLNKIDKIAFEAVEIQATPGCQILIAKNGKVIFDKNYGFYTYDSLRPITGETIYDLASITKVAATLQTVLFMVERGLVNLDYKMSNYLPELEGTNKEDMIIRDILSHQAGLWPWIPFWKNTMENEIHMPNFYSYHPQDNYPFNVASGLYSNAQMEDQVWQWVIESDLREKKDRVPYGYKYSDMGYYMLYRLAEKILNQPIEDFLSQNIYEPLGASTLNYLPLCKFPADLIAPTENDTTFRKRQLIGTVHDQGAAMIGGVAGHAGLFSNANDLAKLFQMHLQNGNYGGVSYFSKQTLEKFKHPQYETNRRGAGWDKPIPGAWYGPTGENVSAYTYGHTGFTGTAAWVDPEYNLVYIFLSNRVFPDASNAKLYRTNIRTRIQDLIYEAIWSYGNKND